MTRAARARRHLGAFRGFVLVTTLACIAGAARATSNDCLKAPDGTPCRSDCLAGGTCARGTCVGGHPVPDGAACATGLVCTTGDRCVAGTCVAGPPLSCPPGACGPGQCAEGVGCFVEECDLAPARPDGGTVEDAAAPPDLATPPDLAPHGDGGVADAGAPPADSAVASPRDLAGDTSDDAAHRTGLLHVHGSGCSLSRPGAAGPGGGALPWSLLAAACLLRRRAPRR